MEYKYIKNLSNEKNKYYISNTGIIKSKIKNKETYLKPFPNEKGYLLVRIGKRNIRVHRLVYEHFGNDFNPNYHIHHKDGNKQNNHIDNLECVNPSEHAIWHNTHDLNGNWLHNAPTPKQIKEIQQKYKPRKYTKPMLAKEYNLSLDSVKWIIKKMKKS